MSMTTSAHNSLMSIANIEDTAKGVNWDLSALFSSIDDPKVEETWVEVGKRADEFEKLYRGKIESGELTESSFLRAIQDYEALSNLASKPVLYANLIFAADTSQQKHGAFLQEQSEKLSEIRVKIMFFELEIQGVNEDWLRKQLEFGPLKAYEHYLSVARQMSPHILSEVEEVLLEETANVGCRAWQRLHDELTSNQLYPYLEPETGQKSELAQEEILDKLRDPNREIRQAAADGLTAGLKTLERTLVFVYNTLLADKKLEDRLRKFESPESSRHMANELEKETVDLVMQLCKERSDVVERYYRTKKDILGLPELTHIDRYAPLFESKQTKTWEEAKEIVLDSFGSFSKEMEERAREFFDKNWIDAGPRPGKSGGAFCSPNTVDTHPVLLQTYLGGLDDVMTLAHEMGHGVHGSLSRCQTPLNFNGTLPLAELASIFAEMITFERLVAGVDHQEKLALYAQKIEGIFASVHRQSAMFRFEQRCHESRRTSGELSAEEFGKIWHEEIQSMFGNSLNLGDQHRSWWMYVGHFIFAPFYVYAYSFGELLTLSIYQLAKKVGPCFT